MCRSMADIQSTAAEIRRGKKEEEEERNSKKILWSALLHRATITRMWPSMPNVMVALPDIGGALCSTPQSLADAHY